MQTPVSEPVAVHSGRRGPQLDVVNVGGPPACGCCRSPSRGQGDRPGFRGPHEHGALVPREVGGARNVSDRYPTPGRGGDGVTVSFDGNEDRELSFALSQDPDRVHREMKTSLSRGAEHNKNDQVQYTTSAGSYRHVQRSISYHLVRDGLEAEIGPDKTRVQGP